MEGLKEHLATTFGDRVRVRVCGIALHNNRILLAKHEGMGDDPLWLPPGGGLEFGELMEQALVREFKEETGLIVKMERLLFVYEVLRPPFHAIEFFFLLQVIAGELTVGTDPELGDYQAIADIQWVAFDDLKHWPKEQKHALFQHCHGTESLLNMSGYYRYIQ